MDTTSPASALDRDIRSGTVTPLRKALQDELATRFNGRLDMEWMSQCLEGGLGHTFTLRGMGVDRPSDVFESRAHLDRQAEGGRQFRDSGTHPLNAEHQVIVVPGDNTDEPSFLLECHGAAVGLKWKQTRHELDPSRLSCLRRHPGGDNFGVGEADRGNATLVP